jgi:MYXO-CTERM domain-containing protein
VLRNLYRIETSADDNTLAGLGDFESIHFVLKTGNRFFGCERSGRTFFSTVFGGSIEWIFFERWDDLPTNLGETMIPKTSFPLIGATPFPIVGLLCLAQSLTAQILISRWDFNSGSLNPESGLGEALLVGGTSATFATGYQGEPTGGWNIKGFPTQGTLPGTAGVQFNLSTEGFSSVGLSFQIRHSNTSANSERVLWSIDGQPFTEAGRFTITPASTGTGETWYQRSVSLPLATAHQANLSVRIVSDFDLGTEGRYLASRLGSSYSTSGTWRFDNVNFSAVPEPEEYAALSALALLGLGFWRRRRSGANQSPLVTRETSEFR